VEGRKSKSKESKKVPRPAAQPEGASQPGKKEMNKKQRILGFLYFKKSKEIPEISLL
jgi:hypothetical protein